MDKDVEISRIIFILKELSYLPQSSASLFFRDFYKIHQDRNNSNEKIAGYEQIIASSLIVHLFSLFEENYFAGENKKDCYGELKKLDEHKKLTAFKHIRNVFDHSVKGFRYNIDGTKVSFYDEFERLMDSDDKINSIMYSSSEINLRIGVFFIFKEFLEELLNLRLKCLQDN